MPVSKTLSLRLDVLERRGLPVNRPALVECEIRGVEGLAVDVEDVAEDLVTDRDRDRAARVVDRCAAGQAVGGGHRDGSHLVVAEVLGDFGDDPLLLAAELELDLDGVEDLGQPLVRKLGVDDRPGNFDDSAGRLDSFSHVSSNWCSR